MPLFFGFYKVQKVYLYGIRSSTSSLHVASSPSNCDSSHMRLGSRFSRKSSYLLSPIVLSVPMSSCTFTTSMAWIATLMPFKMGRVVSLAS